jgi:cytidylate kinase
MSIVTISRGSFSRGSEIAQKVAQELGYACLSREVLLDASEHYGIPELRMKRAIHDAPGVLERITGGRERYVAYIKAALLGHLVRDDVVYHGLAGHFFVSEVQHVLKVRIISPIEDRIRLEVEREGLSQEEARSIIERDDEQRRSWGLRLYGIDTNDPHLYDLVIHTRDLDQDDAVRIICQAVGLERFRTTPESQQALEDLFLAAEVKAVLVDEKPVMDVKASRGVVHLTPASDRSRPPGDAGRMEALVRGVEGVVDVVFHVLQGTDYTNPWHKV